jgi:hypothetical protein
MTASCPEHDQRAQRARRTHRRSWLRFIGMLLLCVPATQCLRNDEVDCEEAVEHMVNCCPGFPATALNCDFYEGCGTRGFPDLTPSESACIIGSTCSDLSRNGICDRVRHRSSDAGNPETPSGLGGVVCP